MRKIKIISSVCLMGLILGLVLFLANVKNITHSSLVNPNYVSDSVSEMRMTHYVLGGDFDDSLYDTYEKVIFQDNAKSGDTAIFGGFIIIVSIITLFFTYKSKEVHEEVKQTEALEVLTRSSPSQMEKRLLELDDLHKKNLISESEYQDLRHSVLFNPTGNPKQAMIKCPECGKENISNDVRACPECGYVLK